MKRLLLALTFAASGFAQTSFTIKIGSEPTVTVSMTADAVTSVTAGIQNIIAGVPPTTLSAAATAGDTVLHLTSAAGITAGMGLKIDTETVGVASVSANDATVVRAQIGTTAAAHLIAAPVLAIRSGLYGVFVANLVADAIRVFMVQYPATTITTANATIATAQGTIATAVGAGITHVP